MGEEQGFQASEGHRLCHTDSRMKEEQGALAKAAFDANSAVAPKAAAASASFRVVVAEAELAAVEEAVSVSVVAQPKRCGWCRKRVGLTGFKCRCGAVHCGSHRYAEQHGCAFDYKAAGKEEIKKANPVVKAGKLNKI